MVVTDNGFGAENSTGSTDGTVQTIFPEYVAEKILQQVFTPCLLLVGTFGNIATICVMRRIKDHNSSQHAILMTLAVSDFLLIQTGMWRRLLWNYFHIDFRNWHSLLCKFYFWLLNDAKTLSSWLVTFVTVQRAMSVTWPHKMRAVCTLQRTWIVVASLVSIACIVNVHFLVGMDIDSKGGCNFGSIEYFKFLEIWTWIDMLLASGIPVLCQVVCDVVLCMALFKAASMSVTGQATSDANDGHGHQARRKTASNITVMCLALSCTFLILTLPIFIQLIYFRVVHLQFTPKYIAVLRLLKSTLNIMWYVNSAINFFLFCITGTRFRTEFVDWICCRSRRRHSAASVGDATTKAGTGRKAPA